ncbi:restriction endonuclease fold toxin-2 domain-containing protein [Streptomyces sp. NPDC015661]|uniref:restriction endonuclease fold toxin-2 domain-containing protein n=1 Tax=Streptomyces sp. NPDC015661 TaxID=3364961 RepID=UPI0036FB387B
MPWRATRPEPYGRRAEKGLIGRDESELEKYRQAMNEHQQIRGLEIVTSDKEAAAYWQTLMALQQLPGTARYVK